MKQSAPLIVMVVFTLATLSYGGKMAEDRQQSKKNPFRATGRTPASVLPLKTAEDRGQLADKTFRSSAAKTGQDSVIIAGFPPGERLLEVEEIH